VDRASSYDRSAWVFYLLFTSTLLSVFFTHPFLLFPFDSYIHLSWIENQDPAIRHIQRETWHWIWANIFHLLHLDKYSVFHKAHIIHYTQIIAVFLMIYYFSKNIFTYLFKQIAPIHINYLSYWSAVLWFTILSTYSAYHHEVWIVWYSVTYQITLPLILAATGLLISLLYAKEQSYATKIIKLSGILLINFIVLNIHPMEILYFILYIAIFILISARSIFLQVRKLGYWLIPIFIVLLFLLFHLPELLQSFSYRKLLIFQYFSFDKFPQLYDDIITLGTKVVKYFSRSKHYMNELIYLDLFLLCLMTGIVLFRYMTGRRCHIRIHLFSFIALASLLLFIPQNIYSAGIASIFTTYTDVVYRFAYSSILFLILPIFVYYTLSLFRIQKTLWLNLSIVTILMTTIYYSAFSKSATHNYARNIISLAHMFTTKNRSFLLSEKEIRQIGKRLYTLETHNQSHKPLFYYARPDIAYVIKYIYHKDAMIHIKPQKKNYKRYFKEHNNRAFTPILFKVPNGFPPYKPYIPPAR